MLRLFLAPAGALNVMLHHFLPFSHPNAMDRAFFHLGVPYFSFWWLPNTNYLVLVCKWMNGVQTRASKAEEEVAELVTKAQRLEVELDKCKEQLTTRLVSSKQSRFSSNPCWVKIKHFLLQTLILLSSKYSPPGHASWRKRKRHCLEQNLRQVQC